MLRRGLILDLSIALGELSLFYFPPCWNLVCCGGHLRLKLCFMANPPPPTLRPSSRSNANPALLLRSRLHLWQCLLVRNITAPIGIPCPTFPRISNMASLFLGTATTCPAPTPATITTRSLRSSAPRNRATKSF